MDVSSTQYSCFGNQINPSVEQNISLEEKYKEEVFKLVDIRHNCRFDDYLSPNEKHPEAVEIHLSKQQEEGVIVSTGTVRCWYNVIFANNKCTGLVNRDFNHRVKACFDFDVLLFRIFKIEEYFKMSAYLNKEKSPQEFTERVALIRKKTECARLKEHVKNYYLHHLDDFASVYLQTDQSWRSDPAFLKGNFEKKEFYSKLRKFAKSGNMISTIGKIDNLDFLKETKIAIVDTSNICHYTILAFKAEKNFHPLIIWTKVKPEYAEYHSLAYDPLTEGEMQEFEGLFSLFKEVQHVGNEKNKLEVMRFLAQALHSEDFETTNSIYSDSPSFYINSKSSLEKLKKFKNKYILQDPNIGNISFCHFPEEGCYSKRLTKLKQDEINLLCKNSEIKKMLPILLDTYPSLKATQILGFMQIENWKGSFKEKFRDRWEVEIMIKNLQEENLVDSFILKFGEKEWAEFTSSLR